MYKHTHSGSAEKLPSLSMDVVPGASQALPSTGAGQRLSLQDEVVLIKAGVARTRGADASIAGQRGLQAAAQRQGLHCSHCGLRPALQQSAEVVIDPAGSV